MYRAHRFMMPLLVLLLPGCAFLAEAECRGRAERAGVYLGQRYAGENCTTSSHRSRDGRHVERFTRCTPNFVDVWQWNTNSDRVFAACMAANVPQTARPPAPPVPVPQAEPVK